MTQRNNKDKIKDAFDEFGDSDQVGDPYRYDDKNPRTPIAQIMFDDRGYLTNDALVALGEVVNERNVRKMCLAVQILCADNFAHNTKGNYSTIYLWR